MKTKATLLSIIFILTACYPRENKQIKESGIITQEISQTFKMSNNPIKVSKKTTNIKHLNMDNQNWIQFSPENSNIFSESFKKRMNEELLLSLYDIIGEKVSRTEFNFLLSIDCQNLNLVRTNDHVFITASLRTIFAKSYYFTIGWSSPEFTNPLEIHKSDVKNKKVEFNFCDDFPSQQIINDLMPTEIISHKKSGYKFDIEYYLYVFPDVIVYFEFSENPTEDCLKEIKKEFEKYDETYNSFFVGDLVRQGNYYSLTINFDSINFLNYSEKDFEKDIKNLEHLFTSININPQISDLKIIKFQ